MTSRTFIIDRGGIAPRMQGRFTTFDRQHDYVAHLPGYIVGVLAGVELAKIDRRSRFMHRVLVTDCFYKQVP
jgi:hypothetical protein